MNWCIGIFIGHGEDIPLCMQERSCSTKGVVGHDSKENDQNKCCGPILGNNGTEVFLSVLLVD